MTEENNNQPATPPINYEEHLDWFRVFVFIILPIQFIANIYGFYQLIQDFDQYILIYAILMFLTGIITLISIPLVIITSIKQKPIGYYIICFYSIFIASYKLISFAIIYLYQIKQIPINYANETISNYLFTDSITVLFYVGLSIINLIYFSHRKFLFGIYPEEPTTPVPEQEPKENHQ